MFATISFSNSIEFMICVIKVVFQEKIVFKFNQAQFWFIIFGLAFDFFSLNIMIKEPV